MSDGLFIRLNVRHKIIVYLAYDGADLRRKVGLLIVVQGGHFVLGNLFGPLNALLDDERNIFAIGSVGMHAGNHGHLFKASGFIKGRNGTRGTKEIHGGLDHIESRPLINAFKDLAGRYPKLHIAEDFACTRISKTIPEVNAQE